MGTSSPTEEPLHTRLRRQQVVAERLHLRRGAGWREAVVGYATVPADEGSTFDVTLPATGEYDD